MKFYGKTYSKFKLSHGDFLEKQHRADVLQSTIVFVNNFAFGPEVDQHLKDIFADLIDGARIFSSKSFCALNFRITDRNLSGKLIIFYAYSFNESDKALCSIVTCLKRALQSQKCNYTMDHLFRHC